MAAGVLHCSPVQSVELMVSRIKDRSLSRDTARIMVRTPRHPSEIIVVIAARPNFMKAAPVLRALRAYPVPVRLVHTGQHYDAVMSDVFLQQLDIPEADSHLSIGSGNHGAQTGRALHLFESYLLSLHHRPVGVVVFGDVNSTFACALAASKLAIPVAHVEAGLRSFDRSMPEEINRILTDALSDILFVSEPSGIANLAREGVSPDKIHFAGNVMIDTLARELPVAQKLDVSQICGFPPGGYALVTLHRPSNVDNAAKLKSIAAFLLDISRVLPVVFPVHPRTRNKLGEFQLLSQLEGSSQIRLLEPLGYRENLALMSRARLVLTDSGGIQEETSFLQIPCLTLRSNTERPVTITQGTNTLIGDDLDKAYSLTMQIVAGEYKRGTAIPRWDGHAAERIAAHLTSAWLETEPETLAGVARFDASHTPVSEFAAR